MPVICLECSLLLFHSVILCRVQGVTYFRTQWSAFDFCAVTNITACLTAALLNLQGTVTLLVQVWGFGFMPDVFSMRNREKPRIKSFRYRNGSGISQAMSIHSMACAGGLGCYTASDSLVIIVYCQEWWRHTGAYLISFGFQPPTIPSNFYLFYIFSWIFPFLFLPLYRVVISLDTSIMQSGTVWSWPGNGQKSKVMRTVQWTELKP